MTASTQVGNVWLFIVPQVVDVVRGVAGFTGCGGTDRFGDVDGVGGVFANGGRWVVISVCGVVGLVSDVVVIGCGVVCCGIVLVVEGGGICGIGVGGHGGCRSGGCTDN